MNLEIQSRLSFYRRLEEVEHKKGISLVRHVETGQIYVEKVLTQYDKSIYDWLQQSYRGSRWKHILNNLDVWIWMLPAG